jgi:hypothetical protein
MNARTLTCAILAGLGWAWAAQGQEQSPPTIQPPPIKKDLAAAPESPSAATPPGVVPPPVAPPGAVPPGTSGLSDWILYRRPDCCSAGPLHPLYSEAYLRVGPSMPVGGNFLGRELQTGWTIQGGVRALCFNPEQTSAWVVDAHIVNSNNSGGDLGDPIILNIFLRDPVTGTSTLTPVTATVRNYNRTMVGIGGGKEWYPWAPANDPGGKWRLGVDAGGRYGSASMTFNETRHRTDVIAGIYTAFHTDYEIPCGCCFISIGLRFEWAYTWGDILQKGSDVQELNSLVTFGVRY